MATRSDMSFAVSYPSPFNSCFGNTHWTEAKRVLRYLKETNNIHLTYTGTGEAIIGLTDADRAACEIDRRS